MYGHGVMTHPDYGRSEGSVVIGVGHLLAPVVEAHSAEAPQHCKQKEASVGATKRSSSKL